MAICFEGGHPTVFCPTGDEEDVILGSFVSKSGEFHVTCTDSILTLFCLSTPTISVIGSLDVSDIVSAAGPKYADTEGTLFEVMWNPEETLLFISTIDGLLGISEIVSGVAAEFDYEDDSIAIRPQFVPYRLELRSVLIFPMKEFLLVSSKEKLFVISKQTRLVLLVDWKNYTVRAKRYLLPSKDMHGMPEGSSCIITVLPRSTPIDEAQIMTETVFAKSAVISSESLYIMYMDGSIRKFAVSVPTAPMHAVLPCCEPATHMAASEEYLTVATSLGVSCFSNTLVTWTVSFEKVSSMSWSMGYLLVAHGLGISLLNACGKLIVADTTQSRVYLSVCLSVRFKSLSLVTMKSGCIEFVNLALSGNFFSRCNSSHGGRIYASRDSLRVVEFSCQELGFIPNPAQYSEENGGVLQVAVQINRGVSLFVLVSGKLGFALFSRFGTRKQSWEVLANKSQERRIGEIDFFGFLTESVFVTKSTNSDQVILWSVFKRIDLAFSLATVQLGASCIDAAAVGTAKLLVAYSNRIDVLFLQTDKSQYSLELSQSISTDFPVPIHRLVFIESIRHPCILGVAKDGQGYLCSGVRVCGGIDQVFPADHVGYSSVVCKPVISAVPTDSDTLDADVYDDEPNNDSCVGSETDDASYNETDDSMETTGDENYVETFFIGDSSCFVCDKIKNIQDDVRIVNSSTRVAIRRSHPLVWILDLHGSVSLWVVVASNLRFITRYQFQDGGVPVCVWPEAGVFAAISPATMRVSYTSAIHALLNVVPEETAFQICKSVSTSLFFSSILELYLHTCLEAAMPVLPRNVPVGSDSSVLWQCEHSVPSLLISRLLQAFKVASYFPSVFPTVFASSIRKTEPHIVFPLADFFTPESSVHALYTYCVKTGLLREAALLLVILQEKIGPEKVRAKFAIPLFKEALVKGEYGLAREIADFYQHGNASSKGLAESLSEHVHGLKSGEVSEVQIECLSHVFENWMKSIL